MKRKLFIISLLMVTILSLPSCDFLRTVAGRPTSGELEIKKAKIEAEDARKKAAAEAEASRRKAERDSLEALKEIATIGIKIENASKLVSASQEPLDFAYYLIIGSFQEHSNAQKLLGRALDAGFGGQVIKYKSGSSAVAICPSDNLVALYSQYKKAVEYDFCPSDSWFLANDR